MAALNVRRLLFLNNLNVSRETEEFYDNPAFQLDIESFKEELEEKRKEEESSEDSCSYLNDFEDKEHSVPINDLLKYYGHEYTPDNFQNISVKGLDSIKVTLNRASYGENKLRSSKKRYSEPLKFLKNLFGGLNAMLWICAVVSIAAYIAEMLLHGDGDTDNLAGGISLTVIIFIAGIFTYYQTYKSNKVMNSFRSLLPQKVTVIREGQRLLLDSGDLVVGDIVEIKYGEKIPADMRILNCTMLKTDHSSLTGESESQERSAECTSENVLETKNLLFFSTTVTEGVGSGVVVRVGSNTIMGRLAGMVSSLKTEKTLLAKEASRIIKILSVISLLFAVGFFIGSFFIGYGWIEALFNATGILLANVPENLQVTLTLILVLAAKKMAKNECIVKNLHAMETLGGASVLCTDKTGTLTENKMSVNHIWLEGNMWKGCEVKNMGNNYLGSGSFLELGRVTQLCLGVNMTIQENGEGEAIRVINGEPCDKAIFDFMENISENVENYGQKHSKIFEIPFNSRNKFHLTVHNVEEEQTEPYTLVGIKGAPEILLEMCGKVLANGENIELDEYWKEKVQRANESMAEMGERVLALCDCTLPRDFEGFIGENLAEELKKQFRFLGLISLVDPPRSTVPAAIEKCRNAGIQVVMITGDQPITATVIARNVGILTEFNGQNTSIYDGTVPLKTVDMRQTKVAVITGPTLQKLNDHDFEDILSNFKEIVFARTSPEEKVRIVETFQKIGHIVAVTGDGINDGAALKRSDIGVAMGSGTDVSKEVADIILLDDDFTTIVTAVEQGRLMFENLKKLMRYVMSDNVAEMYMALVFIIIHIPLPMGPMAMMLSTLCIDMFPALSLAREPAESDIMRQKPRTKEEGKLMTSQMISYAYGQISVIECAAGFFSYFVTFAIHGWLPENVIFRQNVIESAAINDLEDSYGREWSYADRKILVMEAQSAFFMAIVLTQFTNAICCKTRRLSIFQKEMTNHYMNAGLVAMVVLGFVLIYMPGLNSFLSFSPLRYESIVAILPFCLYIFVYDELRRFLVRSGNGNWFSQELQT